MLSCSELTEDPLNTTKCIPPEVCHSNTDPNEPAIEGEDEASNGDEEEEEEEEADSTGRATRSSCSEQSQQQQKAVNGKSPVHGGVVWVNGQKNIFLQPEAIQVVPQLVQGGQTCMFSLYERQFLTK